MKSNPSFWIFKVIVSEISEDIDDGLHIAEGNPQKQYAERIVEGASHIISQ